MRRRFGDLYEDSLSELIHVKHSGSIQSYIDDFELAHTEINILLPEHALSIFLSNLDPQTQAHFNPTTLAQACQLAKLHDATKRKQPSYKPNFQSQRPNSSPYPRPNTNQATKEPNTSQKPYTLRQTEPTPQLKLQSVMLNASICFMMSNLPPDIISNTVGFK